MTRLLIFTHARIYECVCLEALTKGGWSVGTDCENESSQCTRGILVCVWGVLFLFGRKDGTVFTGKMRARLFVPCEIGREWRETKVCVDLKGNATVFSLTSHLLDYLRNLGSVSVGKTGLPQTACDLCDSLDRWW